MHEHAAQAIEEVYRYKLDDRYSELAHHYSRSGNTQKAVDYLQLGWATGSATVGTSGSHHTPDRCHGVTRISSRFPCAYAARTDAANRFGCYLDDAKGYTALETKNATRGRGNCVSKSVRLHKYAQCSGRSVSFTACVENHSLALEPEEQLLTIAERQQDPVLLVAAHTTVGSHLWWTGSLTAARTHLEQGMHSHDLQSQKSMWMSYGVDLGMLCVTDLALVLVVLWVSRSGLEEDP